MYNGIAVYNKRVAWRWKAPLKSNWRSCRAAVSQKALAVVEIPVNFGFEIDENSYYGSGSYERSFIAPAFERSWNWQSKVEILNNAERPVIYAGCCGKAGEVITELSRKIKAPIITTGKNLTFEWNYEGLTGLLYRVGWHPPTKWSLKQTQFFLSLVQNLPFAEVYVVSRTLKNPSVDIDPYKLGKRHALDASILGDAGQAAKAILTSKTQ